MIVVIVVIALAGVHLGGAVVARHRAQAGADLAALAGAAGLAQGPGAACRQALVVATAMAATLPRCEVDGLDVVVAVAVGTAQAVARAGPLS